MLRSEVTGQRPRALPRTERISVMEKVVRELAYELWEQAGRPDGRSDESWFAARYEFERREESRIQIWRYLTLNRSKVQNR